MNFDWDWMTDERHTVRRVTPVARGRLSPEQRQKKLAARILEAAEYIEANLGVWSLQLPKRLHPVTVDADKHVQYLAMTYPKSIYFEKDGQWWTIAGHSGSIPPKGEKLPMTGELRAWRQRWLMVFGHLEMDEVERMREQRQRELDRLHGEALAAYEKETTQQMNPRPAERFSQGRFDQYSTREIAYRLRVAGLMCVWFRDLSLRAFVDHRLNAYAFVQAVMRREYELLEAELRWRSSVVEADELNTFDGDADWAEAKRYLNERHIFYSRELRRLVMNTPMPFQLQVEDFDRLPVYPLADKPVAWLDDVELIDRMEMWVESEDENEFEAEDKQALMESLAGRVPGGMVDGYVWDSSRRQATLPLEDTMFDNWDERTVFFEEYRKKFARLIGEHVDAPVLRDDG